MIGTLEKINDQWTVKDNISQHPFPLNQKDQNWINLSFGTKEFNNEIEYNIYLDYSEQNYDTGIYHPSPKAQIIKVINLDNLKIKS
jgi:hypothetical protein